MSSPGAETCNGRGALHALFCEIRSWSLRSKAYNGRGSCHLLPCGTRSWSLRSRALQRSRILPSFALRDPELELAKQSSTAIADLAIFRLAGPGAGACEAKLYSDRGVFCKGLVRELGVFWRSSMNVPQPPVPSIAGLHRR